MCISYNNHNTLISLWQATYLPELSATTINIIHYNGINNNDGPRNTKEINRAIGKTRQGTKAGKKKQNKIFDMLLKKLHRPCRSPLFTFTPLFFRKVSVRRWRLQAIILTPLWIPIHIYALLRTYLMMQ